MPQENLGPLVVKLEADVKAFEETMAAAVRRFNEQADHIEQRLAKLTQDAKKLADG